MIKKKQIFFKFIIVFFIISVTLFRSIYVFAVTLPEDKGELNIFIDGLLPAKPVNIKMKLYRIKEITDSKEEIKDDSEENENKVENTTEKEDKNEIQENLLNKDEIEEINTTDSDELKFKFTKDFKGIADIDKRLKEDSEEYVEEIKEFAINNKIECIEEDVEYLTHANFSNLELGKYLVVIDDFVMENKLFECNSFIITIPMMQNEKYEFTINANPKVSEIIIEPPPDENNVNNTDTNTNTNTDTNTNVITNSAGENKVDNKEKQDEEKERKRLPDTGLPIVSVIVLSILGLICIIVGCILDKRTRKK